MYFFSILQIVFSLFWWCSLMHKILNFEWVQFIYFCFCFRGVIPKNPLQYPRSWVFTPMISSKSLIILALLFRPLIDFKLNFVCVLRWGPVSFYCILISSCPSPLCPLCGKFFVMFPLNGFGTHVENQLSIDVSSLNSISVSVSILMPVPCLFNHCSFVIGFEIGK